MNYEFLSSSITNHLKFTDPGGYNYMIDGMEVSERAFFNYWKNMSGTEMYIDMVGSWDNAASVWFLHQTSITETITEESAFLTNSWYGYAQNPGEFGFLPTTSKNRTNIWSGNLGSAGIVNYGGKPSYSFLMGDNLIGLFSLKTITKGRLVTIDDFERGMKMSEKEASEFQRTKYGHVVGGTNVQFSGSLGGGVSAELGYLFSSNGWQQPYLTLYTSASSVNAGVSYNTMIVFAKENVYFSDFKGKCWEAGGSYSNYSLQIGGDENNKYKIATIGFGIGQSYPEGKIAGVYYGNTFLLGNPTPFIYSNPFDYSSNFWSFYLSF